MDARTGGAIPLARRTSSVQAGSVVTKAIAPFDMLSNEWTVRDFYPIEYIPRGVRLTAYGGGARDLPEEVLQGFLDEVAAGDAAVPIHATYRLDDIAAAHALMESGRASGKLVVLPQWSRTVALLDSL